LKKEMESCLFVESFEK